MALTTAVHADAPPILQWDSIEHRNPVCWYFHAYATPSRTWGLQPHTWHSVTGIIRKPCEWGDQKPIEHFSQGIMFLLAGAKDSREGSSLALFPETLRSEYREIRSVIEAYSKQGRLVVPEGEHACTLGFGKGDWCVRLCVTARGLQTIYTIDRWD